LRSAAAHRKGRTNNMPSDHTLGVTVLCPNCGAVHPALLDRGHRCLGLNNAHVLEDGLRVYCSRCSYCWRVRLEAEIAGRRSVNRLQQTGRLRQVARWLFR